MGKDLLDQCSRPAPENVARFWKVGEEEIALLYDNFAEINELKSGTALERSDLRNYVYQLIGIEIKGKKYIYLNIFWADPYHIYPDKRMNPSNEYELWESTTPVLFCDGGHFAWGNCI